MTSPLDKTLRGIGWGGLSTSINVLFQLVFMAVMARLLDPVHFGLIAIANVVLRFLSYFAQLGVGPAIVQKSELNGGDIGAALSVSISISAICTVAAVLFAPLAATFFGMPMLTGIIRALSINFILGGISAISISLLRRDMRFKQIAILESTSYILGYGFVGVLLAYLGFGVWSLVGAVLSQSLLNTILAYGFSRHEIGWQHHKDQRNHFFKFGTRYSIIGFIEFLSGSLDSMILGKFLGPAITGVYGRASLLTSLPVQQPANVITRVLFPIISRLESKRQLAGLQISALTLGSYASAVSLGMVAAAPDIVKVLLGDKWLAAIPIVQILALAVAPQFLSHLVGVTLDALGELKLKLYTQASVLALQLVTFFLLLPYGVLGVASVIVFAEWVRFLLMARLIVGLLQPSIKEFQLVFLIILVAGLSSYGLIWLVAHAIPVGMTPWKHLILEMLTGAIALLCVAWFSRNALAQLPVIAELAKRFPQLSILIPVPTVHKL